MCTLMGSALSGPFDRSCTQAEQHGQAGLGRATRRKRANETSPSLLLHVRGEERQEVAVSNEANLGEFQVRSFKCQREASGRVFQLPTSNFLRTASAYKQSQFVPPDRSWGAVYKRSQFPGGAGQDGDRGTKSVACCTNEPNFGELARRNTHHSASPASQSDVSCTNKPNWCGAGRQPGRRPYKRSQFGAPISKERCLCEQTKPISGVGGRLYKQSQSTGELSRETKPIGGPGAASQDIPLRQYAIIPIPRSRACRAKQSQWLRSGLRLADILATCRSAWGQL